MADEKKKGIFDIIAQQVQAGMSDRSKAAGGRSKQLIIMWVLCMALIFFIVPLLIGMMASGFVDFSNGAALIAGILIAIAIIVVGGILP